MAKFVTIDVDVTINSVNLSDHCTSSTLSYEAAQEDATAMGDDTTINLAGLKNWSLDLELQQDYAASNVDATLFPLIGAAAFAITIKPTSGATSSTNPEFQGNGTLASYNPINASVGGISTTPVSIVSAGTLTRATS